MYVLSSSFSLLFLLEASLQCVFPLVNAIAHVHQKIADHVFMLVCGFVQRMKLGNHETRGGHEIRLGLRVCMYEEYMAATHHLRKDLGRISEYWNYFIVSGLDSLQGGQHGNELRLQETPSACSVFLFGVECVE